MNFTIEHEREEDGRWLAEVPEILGALAYGATANNRAGRDICRPTQCTGKAVTGSFTTVQNRAR